MEIRRYVTDEEAKSIEGRLDLGVHIKSTNVKRLLATRETAVEHLRAVVEHVKRNADMEYESPTVREARAFLASLTPPKEEPRP